MWCHTSNIQVATRQRLFQLVHIQESHLAPWSIAHCSWATHQSVPYVLHTYTGTLPCRLDTSRNTLISSYSFRAMEDWTASHKSLSQHTHICGMVKFTCGMNSHPHILRVPTVQGSKWKRTLELPTYMRLGKPVGLASKLWCDHGYCMLVSL